jgi:peptidoglycan/LPS O-acetylase OafA/YrhL
VTVGQVDPIAPIATVAEPPAPPSANPRPVDTRDNNFDAMRFAMAVLVIWSHCFPFILGHGDTYEPLYQLTRGRTTFGGIAVDVFFIISGFLVTMSWERSTTPWTYLKKRVSRIYPGYIVVTLVCAFVVAPLFISAGYPWMNRDHALQLVTVMPQLTQYSIPGIFTHNPYPGSMYGIVWTIKYEFLCYLFVMLLGMSGLLRRRPVILALFIVTVLIYTFQRRVNSSEGCLALWWPHRVERVLGDIDSWPQLLSFYLSGMAFYLYRQVIPQRALIAATAAAAVAASLYFLPLLPLALTIGGAYLVFWLAFQKYIAVPGFARYGDFSYGIYLYGFPVQQIIVATFGAAMAPWQLFLFATPITIAMGALSWHLVEKWFLRKKAKWSRESRESHVEGSPRDAPSASAKAW